MKILKMKIAYISQPYDAFLPPSMNSIGIWTYEIARRMAANHEVIVYGRRGVKSRGDIKQNVRTHYAYALPNRWLSRLSNKISPYFPQKKPLFADLLYHIEYILQIALDLRREKVNIVHLQNFSQFVPVIRAFNPNIKIFLHMRCEWLSMLDEQLIAQRIAQTDRVLGVSRDITEKIRSRFPQFAERCETVPTGIDTAVFRPLPPELQADQPPRILFVGRITPEKGVHILIEAFLKIAERFPEVQLDIIGAAASLPRDRLISISDDAQIKPLDVFYNGRKYIDMLKDLIPAQLQDRIHFTSHIPFSEIHTCYQQASLLANPAFNEPFGRSLIEGGASGIPIVAARAGGMVDLVDHGRTGFLVEPGDVNGLAQAFATLLENPELRRQMGSAARELVVQRYSWERIQAGLLKIYYETIQQAQTRKPHHAI